ncbi:MAG: ABC transporter permease [Bacteroidetes bacterium]|nr:ABC transporter permease [Bacteroidota bacterium]
MQIQESLQVGLDALSANALRSLLTILGIVFGVGAVIAMLAIGEGAQKEIMNQLALTGVNNLIIRNKTIQSNPESGTETTNFSSGLTLKDLEILQKTVPGLQKITPETETETEAIYRLNHGKVKLVGTGPDYARMFNLKLTAGRFFSDHHLLTHAPVAVIGEDVKIKLFKTENPIGKKLKAGSVWFEIIGVTAPVTVSSGQKAPDLGVRNPTMDIYIPVTSFMLRYQNPSLNRQDEDNRRGQNQDGQAGGKQSQLDKITLQVQSAEFLKPVRDLVTRVMNRLHYGSKDFEIIVPLDLIHQQQKTRQIFNIVLGAIGGISLLVGGIGIMNIMLASVTERTREIGIRRAIGATRKDIVGQFLIEALVLCLVGGILGILFGYLISFLISVYGGIDSIVTFSSIFISFSVACLTGVVFGWYPAKTAAEKDPVESLRYE